MTKNSNSSNGELGNTKLTPKQDSPARMWCFTFNNYTEDEFIKLDVALNSNSNKYIIGKEIGENKTPHLQGYCHFSKLIRLSALKKINNKIHWEKCKGSEEENITYCSKDGNFVTNIKVKRPLKLIKEEDFYEWQKIVLAIVKEIPDERTIHWIWEEKGCAGKTSFAKYLCAKHDAIPISGKKNDVLYVASEYESDIYIMDIPRSQEDYVPYGTLEEVKNGLFMCGKYEGHPIVRNSPHIIIFANFEPYLKEMSADRWKVIKI